jgi:uncharacterized protein YjbI with pentapeptide repeats
MSDADKPALRPANDNPWYCLATLHGEQPVDGQDEELAAKNRTAWNRWTATALNDEDRTNFIANGFPAHELFALSPEEQSAFCEAFAARIGRKDELPPGRDERPDFSHTHFDCYADFGGFLFSRSADFGSATFSGHASFKSAMFTGVANFPSATFYGHAYFMRATFNGIASFASATFSPASFVSATFSNAANFSSARFFGVLRFVNAKFARETMFSLAHFGTHVPDFRGATMHEATEWHGAIWPKPSRNLDAAQAQVYAYERLKQEMERLKKHEDEQSFFRKELRARRGLTSPWLGAWLLNYLYDILSDYGQSLIRPLLWLFGVFAVGFFFFAVAPVFNGARMTVAHAAMVSFASVFSFLPITRDAIAGLSGAAKIIGAIQSIFAALLLFLLGLALRNRFRMK